MISILINKNDDHGERQFQVVFFYMQMMMIILRSTQLLIYVPIVTQLLDILMNRNFHVTVDIVDGLLCLIVLVLMQLDDVDRQSFSLPKDGPPPLQDGT